MVARVPTRECASCAFWIATDRFADGKTIAGECRRFPPTRVVVPYWRSFFERGNFQVNITFPLTAPNKWCGEWAPRTDDLTNT